MPRGMAPVSINRMHGELLARVSGYGIGELTFFAMPIIHGPSEAIFNQDKPAKLRFFAGYTKDIQQEIKDEGGVSSTRISRVS